MNRMMNAGAVLLGGSLIFALAACSSSDPTVTDGSPPGAPKGESPGARHNPKLSVVRSPSSSVIAAVKRISLGGKAASGPSARTPSRVRSGGAAGTCGFTSGDPACDTCITGTCCTEGAACAADADCSALVTCYDACTNGACFSACDAAHSAGKTKLDSFASCVGTSCARECGGPPPPPPPPPPGPGGGACGGVTSGDPACDACLTTTCCGEVTACISDVSCRDFMGCVQSCTDGACEAACQAAHPVGASELTALSTCVTTSCAACGGPPPPPPPPPPPGPASCGLTSGQAACDACIDTSCCAESAVCVGDADCTALVSCLDACADGACANACAVAHPTGATEIDAVISCLQTSCSASCF